MRGAQPRFKQWPRLQSRTYSEAERGTAPKGARSQPGERSLKGAWMNWTQARQPRAAGSPKARLAAKEETRQAALALLASVNAPGPTRSDFTYSLESQQG